LCTDLATLDCFLYFFFSSRRRHTRFSRDWSSDVCSSDLAPWREHIDLGDQAEVAHANGEGEAESRIELDDAPIVVLDQGRDDARSEERRVGKECGSRGRAYDWRNKAERRKEERINGSREK